MLFTPWLYQASESHNVPENQLRLEARGLKIRLADALKAGGESNGIIGRDAVPRLQRLPSSVYWAGLAAWGIRVFPAQSIASWQGWAAASGHANHPTVKTP